MLVTRAFTNEEVADRLEEATRDLYASEPHQIQGWIAEACRRLRNQKPSGAENEVANSAILATFAHEVFIGAIRPHKMEDAARLALARTGLLDLNAVVELSLAGRPSTSSATSGKGDA